MRARRLAVLLATGCLTRSPDVDLGGSTYRTLADVPPAPNQDIDILFVIDNSGSMADHQADLTRWVGGSLFGVLTEELGEAPNLHVAVVTTNLGAGGYPIAACTGDGDGGRFQNTPRVSGCTAPTDRFLIDVDDGAGGRLRNYSGSLGDAFACIGLVGISGCGFEQPLGAMRRALDGSVPENVGFLRPSALLLVVIVSDEDDCSAFDPGLFDPSQDSLSDPLGPRTSFRCFEQGVVCDDDAPRRSGEKSRCRPRDDSRYLSTMASFADFLEGLKSDPTMVLVAGIFGAASPVVVVTDEDGIPSLETVCQRPPPECEPPAASPYPDATLGPSSPDAPPAPVCPPSASPGVRLAGLLDRFPARGRFDSICGDDMRIALRKTAVLTGAVAGAKPCLLGAARDVRADVSGVQPSCHVYDVVGRRTPTERRTELPACEVSSQRPCFRLATEAATCGETDTALAVRVERQTAAAASSHVVVDCLGP